MRSFAPHGPAMLERPASVDMTSVLDPADYWPDPLSCPDWPILGPHERGPSPTRADALGRLSALGVRLNRGAGELRKPNDKESAQVVDRVFRPMHSANPHVDRSGAKAHWRWPDGFVGLEARDRTQEQTANDLVEALHIRGFLRKLDAKIARDEQAKADAEVNGLRRDAEEGARLVAAWTEELDGLAEAAARHQQRLDDEKAFDRVAWIRRYLPEQKSRAETAQAKLDRVDAA